MKQIPSIGERNYYDEKQMDCGIDRMLRLAWTLADLEGTRRPTLDHIVAAQQLRNGHDHDT